ncbi:MAG TPA: SbmA/BacA-like family transporter [Oligoflexia bacterium]|nr:SbmA/BacA-like family transporter [Oligoflexia bacterium]HMP26746.1 SbmA/BacA-like family transporter [Oligoflexia bacterium]
MQKLKVDRDLARRLWQLVAPVFFEDVRWKARALLCLLILFSLSLSGMNVLISYINRDFMTALSLKDREGFFNQLYLALLAFAFAAPLVAMYRYTEERFALFWRRWISRKILRNYFSQSAYYYINNAQGIDNPDQRLEEDTRSFTTTTLSIFLISLNSLITIFAFSSVLWSISTTLLIAVLVYSFLGTIFAYFLGKPLIGLNFQQLRLEADYRYKLVNIRDNAESISFFNGDNREFTATRRKLNAALNNLIKIIRRSRTLNIFTNSYNYLIAIIPTVIVAPLYLNGKIEFGVVVQSGAAFVSVVNALSLIVLNFGTLSALVAVVTRLGTFVEALTKTNIDQDGIANKLSLLKQIEDEKLAFRRVTILSPNNKTRIITDLSFELKNGGMLICGPSGTGKSSIIRAIAGLWKSGKGEILTPPSEKIFFLPQKPYMPLAHFRSLFIYGTNKFGISDEELYELAKQLGLVDTWKRVGGLSAKYDWPNFLSNGEQQKISIARLLLSSAKYAMLDEATTALDSESEKAVYQIIRKRFPLYLSIGHKDNLAEFHNLILELKGDGSFIFEQK